MMRTFLMFGWFAFSLMALPAHATEALLELELEQIGDQVIVRCVQPGASTNALGAQPGWRLLSVNQISTDSLVAVQTAQHLAPPNVPIEVVFLTTYGAVVRTLAVVQASRGAPPRTAWAR